MNKSLIGLTVGLCAGLIDVIPMIIQNLTWDANLSALSMWIIIGFLTSRVDLRINSILKGIIISFLVLLPSAILIGWKEPISLVPISVMTTFLGGLQGFIINRLMNRQGRSPKGV